MLIKLEACLFKTLSCDIEYFHGVLPLAGRGKVCPEPVVVPAIAPGKMLLHIPCCKL